MTYGPLEFAAYLARSGATSLTPVAGAAQVEAVCVFEAVAVHSPRSPRGPVGIVVREAPRAVVLALSSHRAVSWRIRREPGALLLAVLVSGHGESTVSGAGDAPIALIGGFYAFKPGSADFRHLESEVMCCTGYRMGSFQSVYAGGSFEIEGERRQARLRRRNMALWSYVQRDGDLRPFHTQKWQLRRGAKGLQTETR